MARVVYGKMPVFGDMNYSQGLGIHSLALLGCNPKDGSTCAAFHSVGSELTRTKGRSDTIQNGSIRTGPSTLGRPQEQGSTPVSKLEVNAVRALTVISAILLSNGLAPGAANSYHGERHCRERERETERPLRPRSPRNPSQPLLPG